MTWTRFMDMHSGGGQKEDFSKLYIEAPEEEAKIIFYNRFGHDPERVTCSCCGYDYSLTEAATLEGASGYDRNCAWGYFRPDGTECAQEEACTSDEERRKSGVYFKPGYSQGYMDRPDTSRSYGKYLTLEEYLSDPEVAVIRAEDIKPEERVGEIRRSGWVWQD